MSSIPRAVLSEAFEEHLAGRRLIAAVFTTFRFDPHFFEQEVLPVFLGVPMSHAEAIRRAQLDDALRTVPNRVAVYFDQNGLVSDSRPAHLDFSRVPIRQNGIFHPKNVFALVEGPAESPDAESQRSLLVACMSANLTRAGWWENVETCHIEEIGDGESTRLKSELLDYLRHIERLAGEKAVDGHSSLNAIRRFLRQTEKTEHRSSHGWLHTHFYGGGESVVDFLRRSANKALDGLNLEIISPYFDDKDHSRPLSALIDAFAPRETRVYLPQSDAGVTSCSEALFQWVRSQPDVSWASLPRELTRGGKSVDIKSRTVHAKVYRFFGQHPKREFLFIGSVNLTSAGHQAGGNLESGFLVELDPERRPEWWMDVERTRPVVFAPRTEDEGAVSTAGSRLSVRYWWDSRRAQVYWDGSDKSPRLTVLRRGTTLFEIPPVPSRVWRALGEAEAEVLREGLISTSLLSIEGDRSEPVVVLVQEEGMAHKPSQLLSLTPQEILKYWTLMSPEQRAAFLEAHFPDIGDESDGAELITRLGRRAELDSFFDRFAGTFISFDRLDHGVRKSIESDEHREAEYRLFGRKYDSLGTLLERLQGDAATDLNQVVERYLMALCARQLVSGLRREFPDFFREHRKETEELERLLQIVDSLRASLESSGDSEMPQFLEWFEPWFLKRAQPVETESVS